ncbi:hypothetical protein GCM10009812_18460 [Nocardioides marinus]
MLHSVVPVPQESDAMTSIRPANDDTIPASARTISSTVVATMSQVRGCPGSGDPAGCGDPAGGRGPWGAAISLTLPM